MRVCVLVVCLYVYDVYVSVLCVYISIYIYVCVCVCLIAGFLACDAFLAEAAVAANVAWQDAGKADSGTDFLVAPYPQATVHVFAC